MVERNDDAPTLKRQGLYPCEAEVARRLSQSDKHWRQIAPRLEREGLPRIDPLMGGRFWPAVEAFFRNRHGLSNMPEGLKQGVEARRRGTLGWRVNRATHRASNGRKSAME
jgi:hypothetical protein